MFETAIANGEAGLDVGHFREKTAGLWPSFSDSNPSLLYGCALPPTGVKHWRDATTHGMFVVDLGTESLGWTLAGHH
jgi:hypothetical protein